MPRKNTATKNDATEIKAPKIKAPKSHKVAKPTAAEISPDLVPTPSDPRESTPVVSCPREICRSTDVVQLRGGGQHGAKRVEWFKCRSCRRSFSRVSPFPGAPSLQT